MKQKRTITPLAVLAILFALAFGATTAAGATTVKIEPATQSVAAGDAFTITVMVEDVTEMAGDQARVNFDPSALAVSSVTEGEFLKSAGETIGVSDQIDNENGRVTFSYALRPQGSSVTGTGALATVHFTTQPSANGVFELQLTDLLFTNGAGSGFDVEAIKNGTLTITGGAEPTPTATPSSKPGGGSGGGGGSTWLTPITTPTIPPTSTPATASPTATSTPTMSPEIPLETPASPTATPTPKAAGFELLFALVATGAVSMLLRIRK
jgi:hypothetical protein